MTEAMRKLFDELPTEMKEQAIKTNKAFRKMADLESQFEDLGERLDIARLEWKREDKAWRRMLSDHPKPHQPDERIP